MLDSLYAKQWFEKIIVGVDNGGSERMNEYTPWVNKECGGGKGDAYVDLIAQTLKPYIDTHYHTLKQQEYTGIGRKLHGRINLFVWGI